MLMLGIRSGSILKVILPATADDHRTFVEVAISFASFFQGCLNLSPVF